jgi:surfactin synthase thioesterase subunit
MRIIQGANWERSAGAATATLPEQPGQGRQAAVRAYCFHHAGGNASVFRPWVGYAHYAHKAANKVEFTPVSLHKYVTDAKAECGLCEATLPLVFERIAHFIYAQQDGRPTILYGHSMGALFAFEVGHRLEAYGACPTRVIVAGRHAPHRPEPSQYRSAMGMDALRHELRRCGGTPDTYLCDEDFCRHYLPVIWEDYCLLEQYCYADHVLRAPIVAHAGSHDVDANINEMRYWQEVTEADFKASEFSGGHFFAHDLGNSYLSRLIGDMTEGLFAHASLPAHASSPIVS